MSKWPVGEGARQLGLHHAPLVVLGLEVRVWELDRCRPKGRAWHGAAGRGMARAWRSRVRASKLPYAIVIRACALAECLQVAVGVAREEGHVAAAEALDVAVGQLDQRPADLQAEDVHVWVLLREVQTEEAARAANVKVQREGGILEEGLWPAVRQLEWLLVGRAQRVDVLSDALQFPSGAAANVLEGMPGGSRGRRAFRDCCSAALLRLPGTAALLRSERHGHAARQVAQAVQAS